ncbi:GNAT superfamily N-acetyltransferase [Sphingomonas zeicaulis]|uniref:GNAT family N-acetyltransferase n=1 Tax=Sphingomonas zeicaulis TaxID=1632740 RepID=UPI003D1D9172
MIFEDASPHDAAEIAALVNRAYRAAGGAYGWTNERELIEGPRTSEDSVRRMLDRGRIVLLRTTVGGPIAGCIHVAIDDDGAWHTSMLAVEPDTQAAGSGKAIKQEVERQARIASAPRMRMEVIRQREALIAWHRRRGYEPTGAILPFPYDDPRVGRPLRPDLELVVMEKALPARRPE